MTKNIIINGKEYVANFNANKELSQSVTGLEDSVLINWPRDHVCNNGIAVIEIDGGVQIRLGNHFLTDEEKKIAKDYRDNLGSGSGSSGPKMPSAKAVDCDKFAREVLKIPGIEKLLSTEIIELGKKLFIEDPVITKAVAALVAAGFDEEEARAMIEAKQKK